MLSQKSTMKDKLENMHLQERINYGYGKVITADTTTRHVHVLFFIGTEFLSINIEVRTNIRCV